MSGFDRWVGKVAIVTGASSGIGYDIAKRLAKKGLKVVGVARRTKPIEKLAKSLGCRAKGKIYAKECDVSKEEDILKVFEWTKTKLGPVHILVNNAGINQNNNLIDGDTEKWDKVFDVNVIGLLVATREAVKSMRENKIDGHIININSIAGHYDIYYPFMNVYPASKHAVTNLTETLRQEFNANNLRIKITSVSPGGVRTDFVPASGIEIPEEMLKNIKNFPMLDPEDVTDAVLYALSTKPHVQIHEIIVRAIGEM